MIDNKYNPSEIEEKWYEEWENNKIFSPSNEGDAYCIMIPPPNVTGTLHMGHAFQVTLMDVLCRYHRMLGDNTLWQAGTDHAGIATQMVVERKLTAQGISRTDLGREKFIDQVWDWKSQSGDIITKQLRRMGASLDWESERFTLDEGLSIAVNKVFIDLYEEGLIYKGKRLVNWDPVLQTALSDLEVISSEENGKIWVIKYYLDDESGNFLEIATTRPETILGDTAVAVNPDDKRFVKYIGKNVIVPITGRIVPVISDDYVDMEFGTGCLKITPGHDFNDYELAKKHNLEIINIFDASARVKCDTKEYNNLDRFAARKKILLELENSNQLLKISDHKMIIPRGDRSHSIIEPLMTDQWYVKIKPLADEAIKCVKEKEIKFVPENWEKTYFEWMNNIQDWCISRQLWWGHRIPAWYDEEKNIFVAENEIEALKLAKKKNKKNIKLKQETDVLDTWFSSALWPFATFGWPVQTKELKKFYPTSVLVTGFDIIFFWVARMLMMGNFFNKKTPFHKVYVHALVRDEKGQKMSKSKGNVIDPLELIEEYGADSLRFTLISMASPGRDVKLSRDRVTGNRNFITKIWSANNFLKLNKCKLEKNIKISSIKLPINQWIYNEFIKTQNLVTKNIEIFRFDEAAKHVYQFVWHSYCDWYLEFLKPIFNAKNKSELKEVRFFASLMMANILKMLHPFIPFFTESAWSINGYKKVFKSNLITSEWPEYKSILKFSKNHKSINNLIEFISGIRSTKAELKITPKLYCDIFFLEKSSKLRSIIKNNFILAKQVGRISEILESKLSDKNTIEILCMNEKIALKFNENIDLISQKQKISQKIDNLNKQMNGLKNKLNNKAYLKNAPKEIVQNDKKLLKELTIEDNKLRSIVASIN